MIDGIPVIGKYVFYIGMHRRALSASFSDTESAVNRPRGKPACGCAKNNRKIAAIRDGILPNTCYTIFLCRYAAVNMVVRGGTRR